MRRQWYLGFGIITLTIFLIFVMLRDIRWFLVFTAPLLLVATYDFLQKKHTILRNFPLLGHMRFLLEFLRPEIQQYFIANDEEERPYSREVRNIIYQRSKNARDTIPFGTERALEQVGYTWILHSLAPRPVKSTEPRVCVGGPDCQKPYISSRLNVSAMSFGSISANAIEAINLGAKIAGFAHNTGEGGLSPYHLQGGDLILQLGTAYFGCRDARGRLSEELFSKQAGIESVKMVEIKLSQGAKPSHGGILPASKLTKEIAEIRKVKMGEDVLSPSAHPEFHTPLEFMDFIKKLRKLSGGKPIGFKLCIGRKAEFLAICKAMLATNVYPDFITIDGSEGGTGAAPLEYANHFGEPLEPSLVFVHNVLVGLNIRQNIKIICSGKIATGFDLIEKFTLGADICNSARAMMMAIGCIQSKQCNANTCPTGVATQNKRLQRGLVVSEKQYRIANYHKHTIATMLEMMAGIGVSNPEDLKPEYLMRRVSTELSKPLSQIYDFLDPGDLLNKKAPQLLQELWDNVSEKQF